jgi:hypothetical protein
MSSRAARAFLAVAAVAVLGLLAASVVDGHDLAFTNGVPITHVAAVIRAGDQACQREIKVIEPFSVVEATATGLGHKTQPLRIEVRDARTRRRLAAGSSPEGYPDHAPLPVRVGPVAAGRRIDVCVTNDGRKRIGLEGGKAESVMGSPLVVGALREEDLALTLRFRRPAPRSVLSQVPVMFRRAALFRPGWVGPWTFWVLAFLVVLAVPALLARALARAEAESADS